MISTKTGVAPVATTALAVARNVRDVYCMCAFSVFAVDKNDIPEYKQTRVPVLEDPPDHRHEEKEVRPRIQKRILRPGALTGKIPTMRGLMT